jgi:hypothetical protein
MNERGQKKETRAIETVTSNLLLAAELETQLSEQQNGTDKSPNQAVEVTGDATSSICKDQTAPLPPPAIASIEDPSPFDSLLSPPNINYLFLTVATLSNEVRVELYV